MYSTSDYGWLAPDGRFFDVPWGDHQDWAMKHIKETGIYESLSMKERISSEGLGDALINRGWVLLHSPGHRTAQPTKKNGHRYTKAQMDFLFDYYMERGLKEHAYNIIKETDTE